MKELPVKFLSPSSMSLWKQCQRRWRFRYVEKLADPPGVAALRGTFVHRALELLYGMPKSARTFDAARKVARSAWVESEESETFQALKLSEDARREMRWESWHLIEALWEIEEPSEVSVVARERKVRTEIAGVPFFGIVDRVDFVAGSLRIVDYKTGKLPRRPEFTQIMLYAEALDALDGRRPRQGRMLYLKGRPYDIRIGRSGARLVGELTSTWQNIATACEEDDFPETTGPLCAWCPYVDRCAEGEAYVRQRFAAGRVRKDAPGLMLLGLAASA